MKGRDGAEKKEKCGMLVGFTFFQLDTIVVIWKKEHSMKI